MRKPALAKERVHNDKERVILKMLKLGAAIFVSMVLFSAAASLLALEAETYLSLSLILVMVAAMFLLASLIYERHRWNKKRKIQNNK